MARIQMTDAESYTPFEGKGSDLFPFQGLTFGTIKSVTEGKAKDSGNVTLSFEIICREKGAEGLRVVKTIPVTGVRKDGKPNVLGLYEVLTSVYSSTEPSLEAAVAKVRALEGTDLDTDDLAAEMANATVYFEVQTQKFQRKETGEDAWSSNIRNFVPKARYTDAAAIPGSNGDHSGHRPNPSDVNRASAAAPSSNGATGSSVTSAVRNIM